MDPTLRRLIDESDIKALLVQLSYAFDERDSQMMRAVFADTVECDITPMGGDQVPMTGSLDADRLSKDVIRMLSTFDMTQHVNTMHRVRLDGDNAALTGYVVGTHFLSQLPASPVHERIEPWNTIGARYDMGVHRFDHGWRFTTWKWRIMWSRENQGVWDEVARRLRGGGEEG